MNGGVTAAKTNARRAKTPQIIDMLPAKERPANLVFPLRI